MLSVVDACRRDEGIQKHVLLEAQVHLLFRKR